MRVLVYKCNAYIRQHQAILRVHTPDVDKEVSLFLVHPVKLTATECA